MTPQTPLTGRPVILGEVLFDRFPDGTEVLGGAPFNVAWHLQGFGAAPLFVSRVGPDAAGERVRSAMTRWGMDMSGLGIDTDHPTGTVQVSLTDGQPSFEILADQAYDHIGSAQLGAALAQPQAGLVYHGTLILRSAAMRRLVSAAIASATPPVFVDVNLREPWWQLETIPPLLERARWVKLNDAELDVLAGALGLVAASGPHAGWADKARALREAYGLELLVVTRGAQGASAFTDHGQSVSVAPQSAPPVVDTVGAGDAFAAVLIYGLLAHWDIDTSLRRAQDFASRIVMQRGATAEDHALYAQMRAGWAS